MSQYYLTQEDYLMHHGVKGQKWGLRQWQNPDGSLTAAGREHYGYGEARSKMQLAKANYKAAQKAYGKAFNKASGAGQYLRNLTKKGREENERRADNLVKTARDAEKARLAYKDAKKEYKSSDEYKARQEKIKKAAIAGAAIVAAGLATYGAYKVINGKIKDHQAYERLYEAGKRATDTYNFNAPYSMISRQSNLTGKHYYNIKNIYGETIQKGSAKSLEDLHNIRDSRSRTAAIERSHAMEVARNQYFDAVSSKRRK